MYFDLFLNLVLDCQHTRLFRATLYKVERQVIDRYFDGNIFELKKSDTINQKLKKSVGIFTKLLKCRKTLKCLQVNFQQ